MSITLEGNTAESADGRSWSGLWRFTKEKKSFLAYTFKKSGNVVPRDLFDYVSFVNEPPSAITPVPPGRKSKDYKAKAAKLKTNKVSRGRGRPPSISNFDSPAPAPTTESNPNTTEQNQNENNAQIGEGEEENLAGDENDNLDMDDNEDQAENGEDGGDEQNDTTFADGEEMEVGGDDEEQSVEGEQSGEQTTAGEDDQAQSTTEVNSLEAPEGTSSEGAGAVAESVTSAAPAEPLPLGPDIVLDETHPLIGMWEGSFNVKIPTGEESIVERFFFYAVQGSTPTGGSSLAALVAGSDQLAPRPESLSELPPDPLFPYALLPTTPSGAFGLGLGLGLGSAPIEPAVKVESGVKTEPAGSETNTSATAASLQDVASTGSSAAAPTSSGAASGAADSAGSSHLEPSALSVSTSDAPSTVFPIDFVVLLGFGRNSFGRFSVAGIYDEKTGELRCEKKYMVTKFSAKRGRRSYAECAATAAASGGYLPLGNHPAAPLVPPSTRQRLAPSFGAGEDFGGDLIGKRKRSVGGYALQNSGKLPGNKEAGEGFGSASKGLSKGGKSSSKESAQAQAAAALAAAVTAAGPNALVGSRNPDNDDPEASYREAFMDCDTGEVYEGGWYYGLRHGKGVCIYSDGLMYEGAWVAGKEHGKGLLMTGDRQVIYTGDWLEGHMHGFGSYTFGNGDRYSGDWREGSRHGKGDYTFQNGCKYSGEWKDNRRSGRGMFVWTDGSYYSGDWEFAQRHGRGKLELANGFVYDGYWSRNVIEGKGVCKFPGGQEYEGTYKNGLREGRGTISFAEGAVYEGRFREDRFDGQGTLKVNHVVPGALPDEMMIPLQVQSDFWRIHLRAGFGNDPH